ncbi:MAG: hypothetical protein KGL39_48475 [Patescibacteria group bacterium]|nr:hypothetical protein [Patescibacteria group bacterium]
MKTNTKPTEQKPTLEIAVGKTIRLQSPKPHNHSLWRVTGIHYGATQCENLVSLRRLDINPGSAFGKTQTDSIVPMAIIGTHPNIENV